MASLFVFLNSLTKPQIACFNENHNYISNFTYFDAVAYIAYMQFHTGLYNINT
jgi:hypothetical protein